MLGVGWLCEFRSSRGRGMNPIVPLGGGAVGPQPALTSGVWPEGISHQPGPARLLTADDQNTLERLVWGKSPTRLILEHLFARLW